MQVHHALAAALHVAGRVEDAEKAKLEAEKEGAAQKAEDEADAAKVKQNDEAEQGK